MDSDAPAILAILIIFGAPIAYAMVNRYLAHQERMAMIQRGIVPPAGGRPQSGYGPAPVPPPYAMDYAEWHAGRMLHKGIVLSMLGLALLIGLGSIDLLAGHPGPWLLGGLIPMFIGIAQIIIAVLSGARVPISRRAMRPPQFGQTIEPPPPQPPPRDVSPGAYTWRPGTTTELERPPSPPDRT